MALWGTTGIHKYSSPEKFIEFVVKDLWWAAELVRERGTVCQTRSRLLRGLELVFRNGNKC